MEVRCNNEHCEFFEQSDLARGVCNAKSVVITRIGECETYWLSVSRGKSKDIRELPLRFCPGLRDPMYQRSRDPVHEALLEWRWLESRKL